MASRPDFKASSRDEVSTTPTINPQHVYLESNLDASSLSVPLRRRSSHASAFSELSELEYMSNDHGAGLLQRTISNVSNYSAYSNTGPVPLRQRLRDLYHQNYGALLVLLSQVFGSGMNVATQLLEKPGAHGEPMHPFQILLVRQSLTVLFCTVYSVTTKSIPHFPLGPPDRKIRLLLVSRGLFGFFGVFGMYFSLLYLPLSEATVLTFLCPILTCYICSLLLPGETFTRQQQLAGLISLVGVVCIAKPVTLLSAPVSAPADLDGGMIPKNATVISDPIAGVDTHRSTPNQHLIAIAIAMLGVCGATGALTSIRAIGTRAHAFISVNYFSVWSVIVSSIALILIPGVSFRLPSNLSEWGLLLSLGICGFVMQALLTMGLAYSGPANTPEQHSNSILELSGTTVRQPSNKSTDNDIEMQTHSTSQPTPLATTSSSSPLPSSPIRRRSTFSQPGSQRRKLARKSRPSGNRATSMMYCQMLFALTADKIVFKTSLDIWSWLGSGLILSGAVWVAAAKGGSNSKSKPNPEHLHPDQQHAVPNDEEIIPDDTLLSHNVAFDVARHEQGHKNERIGLLGTEHDTDTDDDDDERQVTSSSPSSTTPFPQTEALSPTSRPHT